MAITLGQLEKGVLDADALIAKGEAARKAAEQAIRDADQTVADGRRNKAICEDALGGVLKRLNKIYFGNGKVYWADSAGKLIVDTPLNAQDPADPAAPAPGGTDQP